MFWTFRRSFVFVVAFLMLGGLSVRAESVDALLSQIKSVGKKGKGNAEAARAWKELTGKGLDALLPTLRAMDDDDAISANWLRPASDAICEQALQAKKSLPVEKLEKFLADRKQSALARRIAYEWLTRVEPKAEARWLPKLLDDPSVELRRDAVARQLEIAEKALKEKQTVAAQTAFEKALKYAVHKDQVDQAVKKLKGMGKEVDVADHLGFVRTWHVITPFENANQSGFDVAYPPEKGVDLSATYKGKDGEKTKWITTTTEDPYGLVDLNEVIGKKKGTIAYAYTVVESPSERPIEIRVGSYNALKIFLNGKELFGRNEYHHGMRMDQHVGVGTLKKGKNELLLKICQNEQTERWAQSWIYQARLCDRVGVAVPFALVRLESKANTR